MQAEKNENGIYVHLIELINNKNMRIRWCVSLYLQGNERVKEVLHLPPAENSRRDSVAVLRWLKTLTPSQFTGITLFNIPVLFYFFPPKK